MPSITCVTPSKATPFLQVPSLWDSPDFQPPSWSLNRSVSLELILIYTVVTCVSLSHRPYRIVNDGPFIPCGGFLSFPQTTGRELASQTLEHPACGSSGSITHPH